MKLVTRGMERAYYAVTDPVTERLVRLGVTPNLITTVGATLVVLSAVTYALLNATADMLQGVIDPRVRAA